MTEAGVKLLDELMESPLDGARYAHHVVSLRLVAIEDEARTRALDEVRSLVVAEEGACHDGEGLGCEMVGDYPSRGGYGSCNLTIDRESVLAGIDALVAVPA